MALAIDYAFPLALERRESGVNASSAPRNSLRSELDYGEFDFIGTFSSLVAPFKGFSRLPADSLIERF